MKALQCAALVLALGLLGCGATSYAPEGWTGGFSEKQLEPGIWRIGFYGNGNTTSETVQTFWLYHCAEFSKQQGYDGFEVVSDVHLVLQKDWNSADGPRVLVHGGGGGGGGVIIIPGAVNIPKPTLEADIRLMHAPVAAHPPKVFDSAVLLYALEPLVKGRLCVGGNVCPHDHSYLHGSGAPS
ncbi:MAG: hypothetical protein ABSC92_07000 [Rhizomicrobium sp.]|jgi:hypothetical protein